MKKVRNICRLLIWFIIADFIVRGLQMHELYKKYPVLNELWSGPWYAQMLIPLCHTVVIVFVLIVIRVVLKKKDKEQ